jgi:hypothetical protein
MNARFQEADHLCTLSEEFTRKYAICIQEVNQMENYMRPKKWGKHKRKAKQ